jgi:cation channel sperm-associated protein 1
MFDTIKNIFIKPQKRAKSSVFHGNLNKEHIFRLNLTTRHRYFQYSFYFINTIIIQAFINLCVIINIVILCMDTYKELNEKHKHLFIIIDQFCLHVFLIEFILKSSLFKLDYFKNPSDLIDFLTLITGVFENILIILQLIITSSPTQSTHLLNTGTAKFIESFKLMRIVRIVRGLRALRILKTVKLLTSLQIIMKTCINSFQSMGAIIFLMTLFICIFAVIGCGLFHKIDQENFGTVFGSMFTCIRLLTLDDWYAIYKKNKIDNRDKKFEITLLVIYILIYILIEVFIMLNLFLAVLVDNFQLAMQNFKQNQNNNNNNNNEKTINTFTSRKNSNETLFEYDNNNDDDDDGGSSDGENEDEDGEDDEQLNEIYGICHPFSKTLDPTLTEEQCKLLERHFQLLATIEYNMHEKQNIYQLLEYLVEETVEDDNIY